jgi:hypothetical protein
MHAVSSWQVKARSDCARRRAASLKGPSRDVALRRVFKKCMHNCCFAARRRSAERQKSRSNRTRLDFSGIDAAQLSGVARRRAQSECCRSYQCVRFQRRRAAPRDVARSVSGALMSLFGEGSLFRPPLFRPPLYDTLN